MGASGFGLTYPYDEGTWAQNGYSPSASEDKRYAQHQSLIEQTVIKYLKENNLYDNILNESREIPEFETDDQVFCTCFGVDVYNRDEELVSEYEYAKTL